MPIEEKIRMADFRIDNGGTLAETEEQVQRIYARLLSDNRATEKGK
jgi:dephospho-CoA kinase